MHGTTPHQTSGLWKMNDCLWQFISYDTLLDKQHFSSATQLANKMMEMDLLTKLLYYIFYEWTETLLSLQVPPIFSRESDSTTANVRLSVRLSGIKTPKQHKINHFTLPPPSTTHTTSDTSSHTPSHIIMHTITHHHWLHYLHLYNHN